MALARLNDYSVFSNSAGATRVLSELELQQLSDSVTASGIVVPIGYAAEVLASFSNRFVLSEIRVWHSEGLVSVTTSMDGSNWDVHSTEVYSGYTSVSGSLVGFDSWPKYVSIRLDAFGAPSSLYEVEIQGDSGGLLDGSPLTFMDSSSFHEAVEVSVINTASVPRNVYCCIDGDVAATGVFPYSISTTSGGPFYTHRQRGISIPRDYSWSSGEFDGTTVSGSYTILLGGVVSGTYTTPVLDVQALDPLLVYWDYYDEPGTSIDASLFTTDKRVVQVRTSNHIPTGAWSSGQAPDISDPLWGAVSGTLVFSDISNNDLLVASVGQYKYVQLRAKLNASILGTSSRLAVFGLEESLYLGSAAPSTSISVFTKTTSSGYISGQVNALTIFFFG